jgi:hypothetical protein
MKTKIISKILLSLGLMFVLASVITQVQSGNAAIPPLSKCRLSQFMAPIMSPGGKTGSFVLDMKPPLIFGGTYVNFTVSGTAIKEVDYVALVSPAYIGQSGYGVIQVQTLPDPRGSSFRQAYSVVVTLEPGAGYAVGAPSSATMWIKP